MRGTPAGRLAIFGSVDGLTMFMGVVLGLVVSRQGNAAAWHAALGGGAGELVGMTAGQHMSDKAAGWRVAVTCGLAGALACAAPGVPFLLTSSRLGAAAMAGVIAVVISAVIAWLRPERGLAAIAGTYGILALAAVASGLTGLL